MDNIPDEILHEFLSYLESEDLWSCLQVSKRWRNVANSNTHWRRHCTEIRIDLNPCQLSPDSFGLCEWASAYYFNYLLPIKNWREDNSKLFTIPYEDPSFIDAWTQNRAAVYYYKTDLLKVHEIYTHGINSTEMSPVFYTTPRALFNLSIGLSKSYVAVSTYNIVVIFKKISKSYERLKMYYITDDRLSINYKTDELEMSKILSIDAIIKVKAMGSDHLWLSDDYGDKYFVINLINDTIRLISVKSNLYYFNNSPFIATWDEDVQLYNVKGETILQLDKLCWDVCYNSKILVIGNKENQSIESWQIKPLHKLVSKNVLYHTDMAIHPKKNLIVLAEKSIDISRYTCIDAINGTMLWRVQPGPIKGRCHLVKIISDYVYIWYSITKRPTYILLDLTAGGKVIREGLLLQEKVQIFNNVLISLEFDHFKVTSYIAQR